MLSWYHVFAKGAWREPLVEYFGARSIAGIDGQLRLGIVGSVDQAVEVRSHIPLQAWAMKFWEDGWEQRSFDAIADYACDHDDVVFYAHSKGAGFPSEHQTIWRRAMDFQMIWRWRENLEALEDYEAVACLQGNYWMTTCEYIRSLPPCPRESRHDATKWITLGEGQILDRSDGWFPDLAIGHVAPEGSIARAEYDGTPVAKP